MLPSCVEFPSQTEAFPSCMVGRARVSQPLSLIERTLNKRLKNLIPCPRRFSFCALELENMHIGWRTFILQVFSFIITSQSRHVRNKITPNHAFKQEGSLSSSCSVILAIAASKRPQRTDLTSKLSSVTSITLICMCILPLKAVFMIFEAIAASKWPQRSNLTSDLRSVTSHTVRTVVLYYIC